MRTSKYRKYCSFLFNRLRTKFTLASHFATLNIFWVYHTIKANLKRATGFGRAEK